MDVHGNRGKCAQPCRLPYEFVSESNKNKNEVKTLSKGYLLSTRDLCGLNFIPKLIEAGVMCFKIEGRMKSPEYVATVTRIYRKYIDLALSNKPYKVDSKDVEDLKQVFNRGNFSSGHLDSKPNVDLVYPEKPNNIGIYIGNVSNIKQNKSHVLVNLTNEVSLGDSISFEKENTKYTISELMLKDKNIQTATKGQLVEIGRMKGNINVGNKVFKISNKELSASAKDSYQRENKKILLNANIILKKNEPISFTVSTLKCGNPIFDNIKVNLISEEIPIEARNRPIDTEKILAQLTKTNDTIFQFDNIKVNLEDNLFLPSVKILNELRRNALENILITAENRIYRKSPSINDISSSSKYEIIKGKKGISILLNILNTEFKYSDLNNIDNIYIPLKYFADSKYEDTLSTITSKFNTYIYLPTIVKNNYKNLLKNAIDKSLNKYRIKGFVISNLGNISYIESINNKNKLSYIGNYTLNVYNSNSINEFKKLGISKLTISPELDSSTIKSITNISSLPQELIVYGRTPLMNTNYCFLGKTNKCYPTCGVHCKDDNKYYLKDRMGLYFPVIPDNIQTVTTIYNSKITSIDTSNFNVSSYRIDVLFESIEEINNIVLSVINKKKLEGKDYTNGNLNREI